MTAVAGQAAENAEERAQGGGGAGPLPRNKQIKTGEGRFAAMLVLPTVVLLAAVIGYPLIRAIINSFQGDRGLDPATGFFNQGGQWIGLKNWIHWLGQRCGSSSCPPGDLGAQFYSSTAVTVGFTIFEVAVDTVIGMLFALMMHKAFKGRALVRAAILVPWAIPTAVTAKLWYVIFQQDGILNRVLGLNVVWFGNTWPARAAIMIADIWKTTPFMALLILTGLQIIPTDLYESARVDGASALQRFFRITLPLVKPALVVAVLFRAMDVMRMYDLPAIMTGGANGTTTLSYLVSLQIQQGPYSASALSTIVFIIIFGFAFLLIKVLGANIFQQQKKVG